MQVLENLLDTKDYVYYTKENAKTNTVEDIFFFHNKSLRWWRAFPHVLMLDATYKTNKYKLPFVQIVGLTSTNHTFCIAHAFISGESEEHYYWVVDRVKDMLKDCMEPRVIITDRDRALMAACSTVFPQSNKYLCRWHISQNIGRNCKQSFTQDEWKSLRGVGKTCATHHQWIYTIIITTSFSSS